MALSASKGMLVLRSYSRTDLVKIMKLWSGLVSPGQQRTALSCFGKDSATDVDGFRRGGGRLIEKEGRQYDGSQHNVLDEKMR